MSYCKEECLAAIHAASERISDTIVQTPVINTKWLSKETGCNVYFKLESEQITNSFKLRGATKEKVLQEELVSASSGCHALACAHISSKLNIKLCNYSSVNLLKSKEESLNMYPNVSVIKYRRDTYEAEVAARAHAEQHGLFYISPYNDIDVIHGQATVAVELLKQQTNLDAVFVSVGDGGAISGVALYIKLMKHSIKAELFYFV